MSAPVAITRIGPQRSAIIAANGAAMTDDKVLGGDRERDGFATPREIDADRLE